MKSLATIEKRTAPGSRKTPSSAHIPLGEKSRQQQQNIHHIIQPKLTIGQPNDQYEQEADSVADRVVSNQPVPIISSISGSLSSPASQAVQAEAVDEEQIQEKQLQRQVEEEEPVQTKLIQRQADEEEEPVQAKLIQCQADEEEEPVQAKLIQRQADEEEEPVQTKLIQREIKEEEEVQAKGAIPSTHTASQAVNSQSSGSPMRPDVRSILESGMGTDLSSVRVHEDSASHEASASINAKAFTHKNGIWLGAGQSQSDLHLMAHESTHVVQQRSATQTGSKNSSVQRLEDTANADTEVGTVSAEDKSRALAAAQIAKLQAAAEIKKSNEQIGLVKQKKAEQEKEKESEKETKKKAELNISDKEKDQTTVEEQAVTQDNKKAKAGNNADERGAGDKAVALEEKAPTSPDADPAFKAVVARAGKESTKQKKHKPAADEAEAAQQAAESPASELESKAQSNQVDIIEATETPAFDAAAFKAKLMERILAMAPKNAQEADDFKSNDKVGELKEDMTGEVETQKSATQTPMQEATAATPDSSGIEPKLVIPLQAPDPGSEAANINAENATPKKKTQSEVEDPIRENTEQIGNQMAEANVTEDQMANSNEPEFLNALDGKKQAETQAETAPNEYRQSESGTLETAQQNAAVTSSANLVGMHESRMTMTGQLGANQEKTKSDDEIARAKVASDIKTIYDETKVEVDTSLGQLDEDVATAFDTGSEAAKQVFEDYVDAKMTAYKEERYGGWLGWARWIKDKVAGMPDAVNEFYTVGRKRYLKEMDAVIDRVVAIVGKGLTAAKAIVAKGKSQIVEYVATLPQNLKEVGKQAANDIQSEFDSLEQGIDAKQDELVADLASKYNENLQAIDARIDELKAANAGLVDMVVGFVVGVIETIRKLKEMLDTLLAKIAGVIGDIIADPIGFLSNLIKGIKMGFDNFVGNIMKHLISGLLKWLTGALGPMGITIPEDIFSLKGIFSLVLQVLGLTWDYFRIKAVKLLGEPVVKAMETGFELFMIVKEKGIAGLWEYIKEQFSDLKEMVIEQIKSMIITEVIKAGVKWIIGLLNPVGAFIKAAMAIYEIVKFFIERAAQIFEFVNSVVDSIADIVKGNLSGAAQKVETALANSIPLIIGFLASLLGISGLAKKVQVVIEKVRQKIDKAIDKILSKVKKFGKKLFGKGKGEAAASGAMNHKAMADEISRKLSIPTKESDPAKAIQEKKIEATKLQNKYQPRLENGIKLTIITDENVKGVEQDNDIDFKIQIAPNTTNVSAQAPVSGQTQQDLLNIVSLEAQTYGSEAPDGRAKRSHGHITELKSGGRESIPATGRLAGGGIGYQPGDHRGHLIGDRFNGSAVSANLVPMHQTLNLSTFKTYENSLATTYKDYKDRGKAVLLYMNITPNYTSTNATSIDSYRPASISVTGTKVITLKEDSTTPEVHEESISGGPFSNPASGTVVLPTNLIVHKSDTRDIEIIQGVGVTTAQLVSAFLKQGNATKEALLRVQGFGETKYILLINKNIISEV